MKEIKLYLKLFYEMNYKFIGMYMAILGIVAIGVVAIQTFISYGEDYVSKTGNFQAIFPILITLIGVMSYIFTYILLKKASFRNYTIDPNHYKIQVGKFKLRI